MDWGKAASWLVLTVLCLAVWALIIGAALRLAGR
jgi:hypothetical protein